MTQGRGKKCRACGELTMHKTGKLYRCSRCGFTLEQPLIKNKCKTCAHNEVCGLLVNKDQLDCGCIHFLSLSTLLAFIASVKDLSESR